VAPAFPQRVHGNAVTANRETGFEEHEAASGEERAKLFNAHEAGTLGSAAESSEGERARKGSEVDLDGGEVRDADSWFLERKPIGAGSRAGGEETDGEEGEEEAEDLRDGEVGQDVRKGEFVMEGLGDEAEGAAEELIDPRLDPMVKLSQGRDANWEKEIRSVPVRKAEVPPSDLQRKRMRNLMDQLECESDEPDESRAAESRSWLANLPEGILNHEQFVACSFARYLPAWEEILKGSPRKSAKAVLSWLKRGFKTRFVGTKDAKPQKRTIVESMLQKVAPRSKVESLLKGKFPHQVTFENHRSFYLNWGFLKGEIIKLVLWGATSIWRDEDGEPVVINPLGVAESAGKLRLICNVRYINLFLESLPFRYERLRDILTFTEEGSYMATWDLKSGYFHVPIHPKFWKYFALRVGGVTFAFNVLCFGFSQACYVITKVMQEPVLELRKRGIPLSSYIDDGNTAARTYIRCLRQSATSGQFFSALGAYFGLPKCQFDPVLLLKWLGFMVDSERQEFRLSKNKAEKLKESLRAVIAEPSTSPRELATMAGRIIAASPGVLPAALYIRALFDAMQGRTSWDAVFPTPEAVVKTARFWLDNLDKFNGRRWWPRATSVMLAVDASGIGYGGQITLPGKEALKFTGTFLEAQAGSSSTEREVIGYVAGLAVAA
jgi:hypothetical protein